MAVCRAAIADVKKLFDPREAADIIKLALDTEQLEAYWAGLLQRWFNTESERAIAGLVKTGQVPDDVMDFGKFFAEQAYAVQRRGLQSVKGDQRVWPQMLAKVPAGRTPKSLYDLMQVWDMWRKTGQVPPRQRILGARVKKEYLRKVNAFWSEYSKSFREGQVDDQHEAMWAIRNATKATAARAKMIVETETTYHYNHVRREAYDQADDVVAYLYLAIRDHRTTRWCRTRHGLVYLKSDPLLNEETPPIHWNCRSEIIPLLRTNPSHAAIIHDLARRRRNHTCEPLPVGWGKR